MKAVFKREWRALTRGAGPLFLALVLGGAAVTLFLVNVTTGNPALAAGSQYMALVMALSCALLGMNAFPAERAAHTERALYALPIRSSGILLGKLLAREVFVLLSGACLALYPIILSLVSPAVHPMEGLSMVLAVTVLGLLFTAAAVFCSACSRHGVVALFASLALFALVYFMPIAAEKIGAIANVSTVTLVVGLVIVALLVYCVTDDVLVACVAAALVEIPALTAVLQGNGAAVTAAVARGARSIAVFDGLTPFVNGLTDVTLLIRALVMAALFAVLGILAVAARRQGKRRAL